MIEKVYGIHNDESVYFFSLEAAEDYLIKNNNKFGESSYLMPSRQYLWTEYYYDNKIEKIIVFSVIFWIFLIIFMFLY